MGIRFLQVMGGGGVAEIKLLVEHRQIEEGKGLYLKGENVSIYRKGLQNTKKLNPSFPKLTLGKKKKKLPQLTVT